MFSFFEGFGNVAAGCRLCNCDLIGSKSDVCDPDTGACDCLPGVTGIACGQCLPLHYGFLESPPGCQSCDCHPKGNPYIVTYVLFHIL